MPDPTSLPVVILCGGKGTRLKEETDFKPKPLVTVGGRPILWHIMKTYAHYGHKKFILCLGYKGDMIKDFFLNQKALCSDFRMKNGTVVEYFNEYEDSEFEIIFADTGTETLTGERLLSVQKYIPDAQFMVTYGDGVSNININDLIFFHNQQQTIGTLSGVHPRSKYGLVCVDKHKRLTTFAQKPQLHDYTNGGFMVFQQAFFDYLEQDQIIEDAIGKLIEQQQMSLYQHDGYWQCMDTYQDYELLNKEWEDAPAWKIWD